jgi:hypothetical protein
MLVISGTTFYGNISPKGVYTKVWGGVLCQSKVEELSPSAWRVIAEDGLGDLHQCGECVQLGGKVGNRESQ